MTADGPERVLVAMSGGVDSSVAALLLAEAGHDVTGVTMKLWGGPSDQGCCSVSDVDDARRVADQLGIDHHVFNFGDAFTASVVEPYVRAHTEGRTPNPCIECNRHVKFDVLARRATALGFDAVATGHHARVVTRPDGHRRVARGADPAKDQSYVLYMLRHELLARTRFPVGGLTKNEVRSIAARAGLRTSAKPDSQDVCFITSDEGRARFLAERADLTPGELVDTAGTVRGSVPAVQLVTIGQRKGLGIGGLAEPLYAVDVDVAQRRVTLGRRHELDRRLVALEQLVWADGPPDDDTAVLVQTSAHGPVHPGRWHDGAVHWDEPRRRVAPGQSVVLYDPAAPDQVVGGGVAVS